MKRRNPPSTRKRATRAPQGTPPGFPFPCDDPMVGQKVSGADFAGRVLGCATPPPGKRGRFMFVGGGAVSVGRVSSAEKASARVRQELAERWDGEPIEPPARPIRRQTRQTRHAQPVARPMLQLPAPRPQWVDPRLLVPGALPFMPTPSMPRMPSMAKPPVAVLDTPPRGVRTVASVTPISPPSWLDLSRVAIVASTRSIDISAPADRKHAKDLATWLGMVADIVANSLPAGEASILPAVSVPKEKRVAATVRVRTAEAVQTAVSAAAAVLGRMGSTGGVVRETPAVPVRTAKRTPPPVALPPPPVPVREPWFAPSPAIEPPRPFGPFGAGTPDPARIPDAPPPVAAVAVGAALSQDPAAKQTGGRKWSPLQTAIFDAVAHDTRNIVVMARAGTGKCLGKGTPVMLFDGTIKPVEDIVDGDRLMGPDSKPRTVQSTSTGRGPLYVVNPIKGEPWVCNDVHILTLRHAHTKEVRDIAFPDVLSLTARDPEHPWRLFKAIVHLPDQPFTVSPLGIGDYYGFTLDGDGRFLLGDFTVTHNTTTIIEALLHVPPGKRSLLVAFNSAIRDELKRRAPDGVSVRTLHQHGFMCIRRYWGGDLKVGTNAKDGDGVRSPDKIRRDNMLHATGAPWWRSFSNDPDGWNEELKQLLKLIDLCKGTLANTPAKIRALQEEFELLVVEGDPARWRFRLSEPKRGEPRSMDGNTVIEWVQRALAFSLTPPGPDRCVSFDDMVFVPASLPNMEPERYDFVFVDETQDMNAAQLVLVRKSIEPGGRIVIVGDDRQAIYGWRGADTEAMERMRRELDARLLPLSISYRVPGCSAAEARKVVSDFSVPEFTPDGQPWPEGLCQSITAMRMVDLWRDGDFVITRVNRVIEPLVKLAVISGLNPLALGMGDLMRGVRDVLVAGMRGRPASTADLLVAIDKWSEREEQRIEGELQRKREKYGRKYDRDLGENGEPEELVNLHLNVDAAKVLIKRYDGDMDAIKQRLDSLAISEKNMEKASPDQIASALKGRLVISSVHRIKGQESNRTWVLEDTFRYSRSGHKPPPRGKTDSEKRKREEENLWYVAITRVKNEPGHPGELYYVGRIKELIGV